MIYEVPTLKHTPLDATTVATALRGTRLLPYALERRIPRERNFTVSFAREGESDVLTLEGQAGVKILNDFLPPGIRFFPHLQHAFYEEISRAVRYVSKLEHAGDILTILHEIGHAWQSTPDPRIPQRHPSNIVYGNALVSDITKEQAVTLVREVAKPIQDGSFQSEEEQRQVFNVLTQISEAFGWKRKELLYEMAFKEKMPQWAIEMDYAYESIYERNAWRFALQAARQLEREGFNVLSDFKSLDEMKRFINGWLGTYENGRIWQVYPLRPGENRRNLTYRPIFTRVS